MNPKPESTLADLKRAVASLTRELAKTKAERDEALAREAATGEVLGVINSSPGDLAPVFDAMLERAVRLCEFDFSTLWTSDGSIFHAVARHRVPDDLWHYLQANTPPTFARVVAGERLVHITDLHQIPVFMESDFGRGGPRARAAHTTLPADRSFAQG